VVAVTEADCLFCAIVRGDIPATVVYDGPAALAFVDVNPKAPVHVLVVPKEHLADIGQLAGRPDAAAAVIDGIAATVGELGLTSYRTVFNTGPDAGQSVFHVHAHVLGGRDLGWPPG
jgi:histidine triad (HIT) family protein